MKLTVSIIAAIDESNALGANNALLWDIPEDVALFKQLTLRCPVIMGKKTFESLGNKPLTNRLNIVLTHDKKFSKKDVYSANTLSSALRIANKIGDEEVFIIGGGEIFKQVLDEDLVDTMYITHIQKTYKEATCFFPKINAKKWKVVKEEEIKTKNGLKVIFKKYEKIK